MGFSRQEYWSGVLLFPPLGDLPDPGTESGLLRLLHWQAGSLPLGPPGKPFPRVENYKISKMIQMVYKDQLAEQCVCNRE